MSPGERLDQAVGRSTSGNRKQLASAPFDSSNPGVSRVGRTGQLGPADGAQTPGVTTRAVRHAFPSGVQDSSPSASLHRNRGRALFLLNLLALVLIAVIDWLTPAGIVVGMLASIPIVLASLWDDPRKVWLTLGLAVAGFWLQRLGHDPLFSALVWVPNRILAFLTLPASAILAIVLQRRRLELLQARDTALSASELNRLLMSLLAHDLRSPLAVSDQAFEYIEGAVAQGRPVDPHLLGDVRARLRRSLRAIDIVLNLARAEVAHAEAAGAADAPARVRIRDEVEAEIASFVHEAAVRKKQIVTDLDALGTGYAAIDVLVLRQALAILIDNAIRYAVPGPVRVSATSTPAELQLQVEDSGPGLSASQASGGSGGSGLGLKLCRSLVARAGGSLEIERDGPEGTSFALRLPITPEA